MTNTNSNVAFYTVIIISLIFGGLLFSAQGCDLRSLVQVDVPKPVLEAVAPEDLEGGITLAEADRVWADWIAYVESNSKRFTDAVEDANERYSVIASVVDLGVGVVGETAQTFPFGAVIVSALGLATGLFLKRPGEDKRVAIEKEDSYNAGLAKGSQIADQVKTLVEAVKEEVG